MIVHFCTFTARYIKHFTDYIMVPLPVYRIFSYCFHSVDFTPRRSRRGREKVSTHTTAMEDNKTRCGWCTKFDQYIRYHDEEWGLPVHNDFTHFEFLILEGAQAGLSWSTILKKR